MYVSSPMKMMVGRIHLGKRIDINTWKEQYKTDEGVCERIDDLIDNRLVPELVFDKPLIVRGDEVAERLIHYMHKLNIRTTDDIDEDNSGTDKIV